MEQKNDQQVTFEAALTRLEEITKSLERGDIPLEQSLKIFEEGTGLVRLCREMLDHAEQTVRLLVKDGEGKVGVVPFDEAGE